GPAAVPALAGADRRAAEKELTSVVRRLERIAADRKRIDEQFAAHDQSDYAGLLTLQRERADLGERETELEGRWLELSEQLEG
ncbi:MAG: transporter ATP-binding protein, partial [Naasia sp.]|nr:transporter ATP-binding protein [Naasia sp.]